MTIFEYFDIQRDKLPYAEYIELLQWAIATYDGWLEDLDGPTRSFEAFCKGHCIDIEAELDEPIGRHRLAIDAWYHAYSILLVE